MELFNEFFEPGYAFEMLSRVGHILAGITWIGLLYYFNFVQVPAMPAFSDAARPEVVRNIALRALWWFRFGALLTLLFGLAIIAVYGEDTDLFFQGQHGVAILTGILLALTMFVNVWAIIWPNQKIIIASAEKVAAGGEADPRAAAAAKPAARASRANTLFSIPMLFFMVFAGHGGWFPNDEVGSTILYWLVVLALWAFIELSALGKIGGYDSPSTSRRWTTTATRSSPDSPCSP